MELRLCHHCHKAHAGITTCPGCRSALTLADHTLFVGETFGKYHIESVLGVGGMGVVYRATHTLLDRPVALKIVLPQNADERFLKRFTREARVLAELRHPSIVEVYDYDVSDWDTPYYVMELLSGQPLRAFLDAPGRSRSLEAFAGLLRDVARGLNFAHRKGVIHRDLKPENIHVERIDEQPRAKILDFGIAKLMREGPEVTNLTLSGMVVGTPAYLAPEQILQKGMGPHTDQYALALIVAEIVLGQQVRGGMTLGEICSVEISRPVVLSMEGRPDVPEAVRVAISRATDPNPNNRFPDVFAFMRALGIGEVTQSAEKLGTGAFDEVSEPVGADATGDAWAGKGLPIAAQGRSVAGSMTSATLDAAGVAPSPPSGAPGTAAASAGELTDSASAHPPASGHSAFLWRRPFRWMSPLVVVMFLVAGVLLFITYLSLARRNERGASIEQPPRGSVFESALEIPAPADAVRVLGRAGETILLGGPQCVYLVRTDSSAPVRIPLDKGQEILGSTPEGMLFVSDGSRIVLQEFVGESEPVTWVERVPEAKRVVLAPRGAWLAAIKTGVVEIYGHTGQEWKRRFTIELKGGSIPVLESGRQALVLTDRYLAFLLGSTIVTYELRTGSRVFQAEVQEQRINVIAVDDIAGFVAVGGWFNHVYVYKVREGGKRSTIPRHGQTRDILFLPDSPPVVVIAGEGGIQLWRMEKGELATWGDLDSDVRSVGFYGTPVLALDRGRMKVHAFHYRGFDIDRSSQVSKVEIWALAADETGEIIYVGGGSSDGNLYTYATANGAITSHPLHNQGITCLVLEGGHVASSSDDKTIAVRKAPGMEVVWRSQAHKFLVNQLFIQGSPAFLWSSSSDGSIKKWTWPLLEEQESISTGDLIGESVALQALWVDSDEKTIVAGTWESMLLVIRRGEDGSWSARKFPVASPGLYTVAPVPEISSVLLVSGGTPSGVYLYELRKDELHELQSIDCLLSAAVRHRGRSEVSVFGEGTVLTYRFTEDEAGRITYTLQPGVNTDLGYSLAAVCLASSGHMAVGDGEGVLHIVPSAQLRGRPTCVETLEHGRESARAGESTR